MIEIPPDPPALIHCENCGATLKWMTHGEILLCPECGKMYELVEVEA